MSSQIVAIYASNDILEWPVLQTDDPDPTSPDKENISGAGKLLLKSSA